jgi:hypothetical protein
MAVPRSALSPSRRRLLGGLGLGAVLSGLGPAPAAARGTPNPALRLIGATTLPHRLRFRGTTVGGLSGLDYDAAHDRWCAISDDPRMPRCYWLRLPLSADRLGPPELLELVPLQGVAQADAEALRWRPDTGTLLWSTEGDARRGLGPAVYESARDGRLLRQLHLPTVLAMDPGGQRGPRDNLGLEGLALTPDGRGLWLAMENALHQDGPKPQVGQVGGPCRFTLLDLASGAPLTERAYVPDAIPQPPRLPGLYADNGVSEILALNAQRLLVLERAYMTGRGNAIRLYLADLDSGSDTLGMPTLTPGQFQPLRKTLLADLSDLPGPDNLEAMAWGPTLPATAIGPAQRTLVLLSDDNFNPLQTTRFVALAVDLA